ncbi:uncharacterized protein LOC127711693 [Mytilus californianus]|uniref:uncharacterized protein LOC127711693 n=1 Tax=Mytilus californianus TaxID=6549 RepID=UPI0022463E8B|nr:uncharacterized protein LOC127711693 [Mytilus californianus]
MLKGLIILLLTFTSSVVRGLTRYDNNTCFDTTTREYVCCSNYEDINDNCIKCELGFRSRKGNFCEPCPFHFYGEGCAYICMCNVTQGCDNVQGCIEKYVETTSTRMSIFMYFTTKRNCTTYLLHTKNCNMGRLFDTFIYVIKTS